jgi:hypothetical protein
MILTRGPSFLMTKHINKLENINFVNNYQPWATVANFGYPVWFTCSLRLKLFGFPVVLL